MGVEVDSCGEDSSSAPILEFRLNNKFKSLSFMAGQSDFSPAADQILKVAVEGNNNQLEIRDIPNNAAQPFKNLDVTGVNSLQIRLFLDSKVEDCGYKSVTGVVYNMTLS